MILLSRNILILIFCALSKVLVAQLDSIIIYDHSWKSEETYQYRYSLKKSGNKFILYQNNLYKKTFLTETKQESIIQIKKISSKELLELNKELCDTNFKQLKLKHFGYDQKWIESHKDKLLNLKSSGQWSKNQIAFVKKEIHSYENFEKALVRYMDHENGYSVPRKYTDFRAVLYFKNKDSIVIKASNNYLGLPWFINEEESYNPKIAKLFHDILPKNASFNVDLFKSHDLINPLTLSIYEHDCAGKLKEIAAFDYKKELNDLKDSFIIVRGEEVKHRYWNPNPIIYLTLKSPLMYKNVSIEYYLNKEGKTLYTRDSLLYESNKIISRIQSITFIKDYLNQDSTRQLKIFYYNNNAITDEDIRRFNNKNPSLEKCECNLNLDDNYLKQSIYFQITDKYDRNSEWVLLPDDTIILWAFVGKTVINFSYSDFGSSGYGKQYVCKKITRTGEVKKKE